ncbi:ABC transporter permease [candidate division KSB3 bacterium]|uniref:ABC transporter permease n=1 Tax=candidate division KSB3 bacterium TaxID=2044937 RepID=A0A9D5JWA1_9BACT|nr:ABC transporter permease [candidate division KSB3 bacterium]MBD3325309.1 ABC transporter permease [candidate division KSB3 bacterium]
MNKGQRTESNRFQSLQRTFQSVKWPLLALGAILLYNLIFMPEFLQVSVKNGHLAGSLIDILKRSSPRMIIAFGMTLVIATWGIDVSVGSIAAIAGSLAVLVIRGGDITYLATQETSTVSLFLIISTALLAAALCGMFNGILVSFIGIQPIIATLILMVTGRGIASLITGGYVLNYDHPQYEFLGSGYWFGLPVPVIMAILVFALLSLLIRLTPLGLFIQSTGGNATASRYTGINAHLVKIVAYIISGVCAGIAGIIFTADVQSADSSQLGLFIELEAILVVVMGGTRLTGGRFTMVGTVIGALILQTIITTLLTQAVPVEYTLIFEALVVVIVLIFQSERMEAISFWRRQKRLTEGKGK